MNCLNCDKELIQSGTKPRQYCDNACRMARKRTEEQEWRSSAKIEDETPNARSAREYREFQKKWIDGACEKYVGEDGGNCPGTVSTNPIVKCGRPYLQHHEARYQVYHSELL